jgi:hypothetical protein
MRSSSRRVLARWRSGATPSRTSSTWCTDDPLFGTTTGALGLFELVDDVKDLLRLSDLAGLLDKTYDEPGGDSNKQGAGAVEFQDTIQGFDSAEHAFVHRARIPYVALTIPFCHQRLIGGVLV